MKKNELLLCRDLLSQVVDISQQAGQAVMAVYGREFAVAEKADASPLTEADLAAHTLIMTRLSSLLPALPILSEESADEAGAHRAWPRYWLVDPLDGTKEFIKRNGEFTVNIALIEAGRPVLGVVHAPALGLTYLACEGIGAFRQSESGAWSPISVREHVPGTPWRVVASRSHAGPEIEAFVARLGECELVSMGSSLKLCLVAEGRADVYPRLGPTSLWDTAAAQCVVEQAGGKVHGLDGHPLTYGAAASILNPHFIVAAAKNENCKA